MDIETLIDLEKEFYFLLIRILQLKIQEKINN